MDADLSPQGVQEAAALGRVLKSQLMEYLKENPVVSGKKPRIIAVCSPLKRAIKTALGALGPVMDEFDVRFRIHLDLRETHPKASNFGSSCAEIAALFGEKMKEETTASKETSSSSLAMSVAEMARWQNDAWEAAKHDQGHMTDGARAARILDALDSEAAEGSLVFVFSHWGTMQMLGNYFCEG